MLSDVPPEIHDAIFRVLEVADFHSLRLASRQLEQRSRAAFGAAAFSTLRVDFSRDNLEWLADVSSREDFRLAVREWQIGNWSGRGNGWKYSREIVLGDDGHWPRIEGGHLDLNSSLVQQFTQMLSRFPNCTSATVTDQRARLSYHPRNINSGPEESLTSADAVELMLHASSVPGAPRIQSFRIRVSRDLDWNPPGAISKATIASAQNSWTTHLPELVLEFPAESDRDNEDNLLHLLTSSSNLKTLRLKWHAEFGSEGYTLTRHLDKFPDFAPPLENLLLGTLTLAESDVLRLLMSCRDTLSSLSFYIVKLRSGSWKNILEFLYDTPFQGLRRLSMYACSDGSEGDYTAFCPLWKNQQLRGSCGGTFEFGRSRTGRRGDRGNRPKVLQLHITGFLFETKEGAPAMNSALRACIENSHRAPSTYDPSPPCAHFTELRKVSQVTPFNRSEPYTEWTGLPSLWT